MQAEIARNQAAVPTLTKAIGKLQRDLTRYQETGVQDKSTGVQDSGLAKARQVRSMNAEIDKLQEQRRKANADIKSAQENYDKNIVTRTERGGDNPFLDPVTQRPMTEDRIKRFFPGTKCPRMR